MSERLPEPSQEPVEPGRQLNWNIAYWQGQLDTRPFESVSPELRGAAADDLNQSWAYTGLDCLYNGFARQASAVDRTANREGFIDNGVGQSAGLYIAPFGKPDHQRWLVSYAFAPADSDVGTIAPNEYHFLEASQANIWPLAELEEPFETIQQPQEVLNMMSALLVDELSDEAFLRLPAAAQAHHINFYVQAAHVSAEAWGRISGKPAIGIAEKGYVWDAPQTGLPHFRQLVLDGALIAGVCKGVDVLARRQLARYDAITAPDQLIDPAAGLFLILQSDADTAARCNLPVGEEIYLPISSQELEVTFFETADSVF